MTGQKNACPQGERALALYSFLEAIRRRRALLCTGGNPPVTPDQPNNATTQKDRARSPGPLLFKKEKTHAEPNHPAEYPRDPGRKTAV